MEKRREIVNCKRRCEDWSRHEEEKLQWKREGEKLLTLRENVKTKDVVVRKDCNEEEKRNCFL